MATIQKFYLPLILIGLISSCSVRLIADYDAELSAEIVEAAKKVDAYYADLVSITDENGTNNFDEENTRASFIKRYKEIDNQLYGIMLKNQSKELNQNSVEISKSILNNFWRKYDGDLNTKRALLLIHRNNFTRNFEALLKAELAKENNENN